jgi:hypothetical protein
MKRVAIHLQTLHCAADLLAEDVPKTGFFPPPVKFTSMPGGGSRNLELWIRK